MHGPERIGLERPGSNWLECIGTKCIGAKRTELAGPDGIAMNGKGLDSLERTEKYGTGKEGTASKGRNRTDWNGWHRIGGNR